MKTNEMNDPQLDRAAGSDGHGVNAALLPCPFCGSQCDDCRNEEGEGYLGCENKRCPASMLAMTDQQWNTRSETALSKATDNLMSAALELIEDCTCQNKSGDNYHAPAVRKLERAVDEARNLL